MFKEKSQHPGNQLFLKKLVYLQHSLGQVVQLGFDVFCLFVRPHKYTCSSFSIIYCVVCIISDGYNIFHLYYYQYVRCRHDVNIHISVHGWENYGMDSKGIACNKTILQSGWKTTYCGHVRARWLAMIQTRLPMGFKCNPGCPNANWDQKEKHSGPFMATRSSSPTDVFYVQCKFC